MKNMTQRKFFILYSILLFIAIEIFMVLAINIISANSSTLILLLMLIFIAPLLGSILAMSTMKKYIGEFTEKEFSKNFLRNSIIVYILGYIFILRINLLLVCAYTVGVFVGYLINKKIIEKVKAKTIGRKSFFDKEKKTKAYEFKKFTGENVQEFFKINHIQNMKYLVVKVKPIKKKHILWEKTFISPAYLLCFDDTQSYFFELSKKTKKYIERGYIFDINKLIVKKAKETILGYHLKLMFDEGNEFNLYIPKMYLGLNIQKENAEIIFKKITVSE